MASLILLAPASYCWQGDGPLTSLTTLLGIMGFSEEVRFLLRILSTTQVVEPQEVEQEVAQELEKDVEQEVEQEENQERDQEQ